MTQAIAQVREKIENVNVKIAVFALLFLSISFTIIYAVLIKDTIINATSIKTLNRESEAIEISLSSLETEYIVAKNAITPKVAEARGFVTPTSTQFIAKRSLNPVVSVAHEI